jgi:hypothetical protein
MGFLHTVIGRSLFIAFRVGFSHPDGGGIFVGLAVDERAQPCADTGAASAVDDSTGR